MSVLRSGSLELPGTSRTFQGEMWIRSGPDLSRCTCRPVMSDTINWTLHTCEILEGGSTA